MNPRQLFAQGKLTEAVAAATEAVKDAPDSLEHRGILCELLCYQGDFERADKQLEVAQKLSGVEQQVGVNLMQGLIRSEIHRRECFNQGRPPELSLDPTPDIEMRLKALLEIRDGNLSEAKTLLDAAEAERPKLNVTVDESGVADFRDLDDLTSTFLEVLTSNGKYYWLPLAQIKELEFEQPKTPVEFLWRPAKVDLRDGPDDGQIYVAMLYPGSENDPECQMGMKTEWVGEGDAPIRGLGRRMFLCGEEAKSLLDMHSLKIDLP